MVAEANRPHWLVESCCSPLPSRCICTSFLYMKDQSWNQARSCMLPGKASGSSTWSHPRRLRARFDPGISQWMSRLPPLCSTNFTIDSIPRTLHLSWMWNQQAVNIQNVGWMAFFPFWGEGKARKRDGQIGKSSHKSLTSFANRLNAEQEVQEIPLKNKPTDYRKDLHSENSCILTKNRNFKRSTCQKTQSNSAQGRPGNLHMTGLLFTCLWTWSQ